MDASGKEPGDVYLSARQAAEMLGISVTTLYAYVSRGLLASEPVSPGHRSRRYHRAEVERLIELREHRRSPAKTAAGALEYGVPVLESAITLISEGHYYYRGYDAVDLARNRTLEEVAQLLWLDELPPEGESELFDDVEANQPRGYRRFVSESELEPVERLQVLLPLAALEDLRCHGDGARATAQCAARILRNMAVAASGLSPREAGRRSVARILRHAWCGALEKSHVDAGVKVIDMALVLAADHELNVSSFTARCAASAGTTPYEVVIAGLATLRGKRHGGLSDRTESWLRQLWLETGDDVAGAPAALERTLARRLKQGEVLPGFGHPLYPWGDPRCRALLEALDALAPAARKASWAGRVAESAAALTGLRPTVDFALAATSVSLDLPRGAALALFALGRTVGWIGQAIEQAETGQLIRPRARYSGRPPSDLPP